MTAASPDQSRGCCSCCSRSVCGWSTDGVDIPNVWRYRWSDDGKASALFNLLWRLPMGLYYLAFCLYYTVANVDSNVDSEADPSKHFWYVSNWGLYITGAYILGAGIAGTIQYWPYLTGASEGPLPGAAAPTHPAPTATDAEAPLTGVVPGTGEPKNATLPLVTSSSGPGECPDVNDVCDCHTHTQLNSLASGGAAHLQACSPVDAGWVHTTLVFLFEVALGLGVGITIIYWALLFDFSDPREGVRLYRSVQTHITYLVPLIDLALGRVPVLPAHYPAFAAVAILYAAVNGLYTAAVPGDYLYNILTWTSPSDAIVVIGVFALVTAGYWGAWALARIRDIMASAHPHAAVPDLECKPQETTAAPAAVLAVEEEEVTVEVEEEEGVEEAAVATEEEGEEETDAAPEDAEGAVEDGAGAPAEASEGKEESTGGEGEGEEGEAAEEDTTA